MPQASPDPRFLLWAKSDPPHPLICHLVDAGHVAQQLLSAGPFQTTVPKFRAATGCSEEAAVAWLAFLVALHDIGKCWAEFQGIHAPLAQKLAEAGLDLSHPQPGFRHDSGTALWVESYLQAEPLHWSQPAAKTVARALGGHHGAFHRDPADEDVRPQWESLRQALTEQLWATFRPPQWKADFVHHDVAGTLLSGLTVLSDWIASNEDLFRREWHGESLDEYLPKSRRWAAEATHRLGLDTEPIWKQPMTFREVWPNITNPNALQQTCESLVQENLAPGLVIIEALMGTGKTEAAIYLASQWVAAGRASGMYIALPTAATSNQMHGRVRKGMARHDAEAAHQVRLVHGMSWMVDDQTPEHAPELSDGQDVAAEEHSLDWFRPAKRGLLARDGVGTIDQSLKAAQRVKFGFLRLFGLAGKVLVVDEVHAYDPYMTQILTRLLQWCQALEIPTILLSATLPRQRREALITAYAPIAALQPAAAGALGPYPLITWVEPNGIVREATVPTEGVGRTYSVKWQQGLLREPARIAELAAERVAGGGCIAVMANTVDSAQAIYRHLCALLPEGVERFLFHARFPAEQRLALEQEIVARFGADEDRPEHIRRPERAVVVSTQVLEQSLNVDFDELITEIAPIDLLLQRAGRVHRHARPIRPTGPTPTIHILIPPDGSTSLSPSDRIYHRYILLRTLATAHSTWQLPDQIRSLVEQVYDEATWPDSTEALHAARADWVREQEKDKGKALTYLLPAPYPDAFKLGRTYDAPFDDQEGDANSYFVAKTRLGDDHVRLLLVDGEDWAPLLAKPRSPGRSWLKAIYGRTVGVPRWWFDKAVPADGFMPVAPGPAWLPGVQVLQLQGRRWVGQGEAGRRFAIVVDHTYGLLREAEEREGLHGDL